MKKALWLLLLIALGGGCATPRTHWPADLTSQHTTCVSANCWLAETDLSSARALMLGVTGELAQGGWCYLKDVQVVAQPVMAEIIARQIAGAKLAPFPRFTFEEPIFVVLLSEDQVPVAAAEVIDKHFQPVRLSRDGKGWKVKDLFSDEAQKLRGEMGSGQDMLWRLWRTSMDAHKPPQSSKAIQ